MDRNFWDKSPTPAGFVNTAKKGFVVELCIYSFDLSAKDKAAAQADVEGAAAIWCQAGVNIQAIRWQKFTPPISEPLQLNSKDVAAQILCGGLTQQASDQLFALGKPGCPSAKTIAVYYIPGRHMQGGSTGCHRFKFQVDMLPEHMILLTDDATAQVLSHELGHALMTRKEGANWHNHDPDPAADPASPSHNTNPQNIMFPTVPQAPQIAAAQSAQAKASHLVFQEDLVLGFKDPQPLRLGVRMKTLHITMVDDEAFSDDALESTWTFKASNTNAAASAPPSQQFVESALGTGDRTLPAEVDFPNIAMNDGDSLKIEVTGEDWDFWSPNDALPAVDKTWAKGMDQWGSGSTEITGAPLGDHKESPAGNDEITYALTYNIRVDFQPAPEELLRRLDGTPRQVC